MHFDSEQFYDMAWMPTIAAVALQQIANGVNSSFEASHLSPLHVICSVKKLREY